ncbi:MAG TPA: ATP-dependent DNA helicase [Candidatus Saccharimonadales bacterium]|nr:ATP-dependent DNA helicase [Candidatus Saccharimonadales bacterium]
MATETYKAALANLNDAQRTAVQTTDGPVLVIAGPGTGKTQLLTTRIAHILATTDTLPQNILCLTFTDSAAANMRERLGGMIGQAAYDVTISTYHAFGSDIIRRFPDYFTADANLEPIDELGIDRVFRSIIAALPYSNPLKYADNYVKDIRTLVSEAKRALISPQDLRKTANENLKFIATASPVVAETLGVIARMSAKDIPQFAELSEKVQGKGSLYDLFKSGLDEAVAAAQESGKANTLTAWKTAWLEKDSDNRFVIKSVKVNQKLLAAAGIYEQYLQTLTKEGLFDYDDMILRAVRALETNSDLRFTLQEQYQYLLLDEFQDTNGAQLRLVELLTDNPVHEGRPNVLAVGDDDQAIYAFQGANYSHMLQFNTMYRDVLAVPLTENYRSHKDILHTARGIAEQIEERLHHHFPKIEKTLVARNTKLPATATIERREAQSDVMQFAWVSRRISELIAAGVPPSEIAILAPQHKYLEPLVPFLQEAGVPVRYEKRENVLDDPGITQLLRMSELVLALQAGAHTTANALWAQVLSFDFWGLPTSAIWKLSWQSREDDSSWTDELLQDETLKPVALFFIRLSHIAGSETLETMFDYLIGSQPLDLQEPGHEPYRSPYYNHYFSDLSPQSTADFWNLLSNLIVLRARLREYRKDGEERLSLKDFLGYIQAMQAAELKILNTSPYASGDDAVELLTAYKAKGMEWSAVFVLAVNDDAWGGKSHSASAHISLPANLQHIRYARTTNDERLRLFYVAITRAKSQLYLVNYTNNFAGRAMTRLKFLDESPDGQGVVHSPLLPENSQTVLPAEDGTPAPTTELAAYWSRRHEEALQHPDMRVLLADRLRDFQLSPTHVNDFLDVANCGPQAFFLRTVLRFPQSPRPEMQYGNAIHETLEWLHNTVKQTSSVPTQAQLFAAYETRLAGQRLSAHDTQLFLDRGQEALTAYLQQRGATITPNVVSEYNFRHEGVFVGNAHLSGKIDKMIVNPQEKTIQIVDYKTGRGASRWAREIKLHKYRHQLYLYKALVEGSHTYAGYTVTDAYLEFVEPDEDGRIQELHLELNDTEYTHAKQLTEVVWEHIMALDLPDISGYSTDLLGIEAFEDDLLG